ncbi:MAG: hypothetical protein ACRDY3_00385 [Acidimicrobiales bacterium]
MSRWRRGHPADKIEIVPHQNVRILRDDAEMAVASERAAEGERRLQARLEARAARDTWTAERRQHGEQPGTVDHFGGLTMPRAVDASDPASPERRSSPHSPAA